MTSRRTGTISNVLETARIEGEVIGEARGETNKALEVARNLKEKGLDATLIAETTGIPLAETRNWNKVLYRR